MEVERVQEGEFREDDIREEFEKSNYEKEKDKSEKQLGKERKTKIEERERLEHLYAPPLPFPYMRVEKQLHEKF